MTEENGEDWKCVIKRVIVIVTTDATRYWCGKGATPLTWGESLAGAKYWNGMPRGHHYCTVNIEYVNTLLRYTLFQSMVTWSNGVTADLSHGCQNWVNISSYLFEGLTDPPAKFVMTVLLENSFPTPPGFGEKSHTVVENNSLISSIDKQRLLSRKIDSNLRLG